jgi:hypothetical protein
VRQGQVPITWTGEAPTAVLCGCAFPPDHPVDLYSLPCRSQHKAFAYAYIAAQAERERAAAGLPKGTGGTGGWVGCYPKPACLRDSQVQGVLCRVLLNEQTAWLCCCAQTSCPPSRAIRRPQLHTGCSSSLAAGHQPTDLYKTWSAALWCAS